MSVSETTITTQELQYNERQKQRVADVDEIVDYIQTSGDTWGHAPLIQMWPGIVEDFMTRAYQLDARNQQLGVAQEILESGVYAGRRIDVDVFQYRAGGWNYKWPRGAAALGNAREAYSRRLFYAQLAVQHPLEHEIFQNIDSVAAHGTQAAALPFILEHGGLLSHAQQYAKNIPTGSGETYVLAFRRPFISFGPISTGIRYSDMDIRDEASRRYLEATAAEYKGCQMRLDELARFEHVIAERIKAGDSFIREAERTHFGVTLCLARAALWVDDPELGRRVSVDSDLVEMGFTDHVPLRYLPIILAPRKQIALVSDLVSEFDNAPTVVARETIQRVLQRVDQIEQEADAKWRNINS